VRRPRARRRNHNNNRGVAAAVLMSAWSRPRIAELSGAVVLALTVSAQGARAKERRRLMTLAWAVVAVFFVIDLIWFPFSRLTFEPGNLLGLLWSALVLLAVYAIARFISRRVKEAPSRMGRFVAQVADGVRLWISALACTIALVVVGAIFSYLTASLGLELRDTELDTIDRALGFDWLSFLAFTSASPAVATVLRVAYYSAAPQLMGVLLFLSFARRPERLAEFLAIVAVATLLTAVLVTLVPADDGYGVYAPTPEMYGCSATQPA